MGKALWNEKLAMIVFCQFYSYMLAIGRGAFANIYSDIEDSAFHTAYQLALSIRRTLVVQASHHAITAHRLVVLAEVNTVSQDWGNLFFKLSLAETLKDVATRVTEETWLNNENAFNICFDYIHFLYFKKGRLHTKSRKVAYKISPRHFTCHNYFLLKF